MLSRSFIDVLFILLLGTIVMLTHSVQLDEVDADLLRLGHGGTRPLRSTDVAVVVVAVEGLSHEGVAYASVSAVAATLPADAAVILVADGPDVRHHRVMTVWSVLREAGFDVSLGAAPQ